jgi:hypothetical protein
VSATYDWKSPDLEKLRFVIALVQAFLGEGANVQPSLGRNAPGQPTQTYTSMEAWSAALSPDWDWFSLYGNSATRWVSVKFKLAEQQVVATFNAAGAEMEPVTSALAELQKTLALPGPRLPILTSAPQKPKERIEGRYHLEHPEDVSWFAKLLQFVEAWTGAPRSFVGGFQLLSAPQFRRSPAHYEDWKQQCLDNWKDILNLDANISGQSRDASLNFFLNGNNLRLALSAENAADIADSFKAAEQQLPILPARDFIPPESRSEQLRRYFAKDAIDKPWFERCMALLRSLPSAQSRGNLSFQGRFRIKGREDEAFSRTNYDAWMRDVMDGWNQIVWLYCWISAPDIGVTFEVDLLRDLITLTLQSSVEQTVKAGFAAVEAGLGLKKVEGDPYQYRRFLRSFPIEGWTTNKMFADAVRESVAFAFPQRDPVYRLALVKARVAVGEAAEYQEDFTDFELCCRRLESQDFTGAEVTLQGPLGRALGIEANRQTKMLYVRTSLDRADLDSLTLLFRNAMDLGKPDTKVLAEAKKPEESKSGISAGQLLTVFCALIAATAAVLTSSNGLSLLHQHTKLHIMNPPSPKGEKVKLGGSSMYLGWELDTTGINGTVAETHIPVTILVTGGTPPQEQTYHSSEGSLTIPFPAPGDYTIKITSDVDHNNTAYLEAEIPQEVKAEEADAQENKAAARKHAK